MSEYQQFRVIQPVTGWASAWGQVPQQPQGHLHATPQTASGPACKMLGTPRCVPRSLYWKPQFLEESICFSMFPFGD